MGVNDVVVSHLTAARDALLLERQRIDRAIKDLERMLLGYAWVGRDMDAGAVAPEDIPDVEPPSPEEGTPQMRDAIKVLVRERGPVKAGDAALILRSRYGWSQASVRSLLSKMAKAGEIARVDEERRRGYYDDISRVGAREHNQDSEGVDAEAPVGAGASESEEPSEGSSWEMGGTANGAALPGGRGDHSDDAEWDHGHGNRASLAEAR